MRLLYVVNGFPPTALGGVEVYTWEITRAMAHRGHTVGVFCRESDLNRPDYELIRDEVDKVPVFRVVNDFKGAWRFPDTYMDEQVEELFLQVLQQFQPELIAFQHLIGLSARLPLQARALEIPMVMSLHDFWPLCHRVHLLNRWNRPCPGPLQGGDCVSCVRGSTTPSRLLSFLRDLKPKLPPALRSWLMRRVGGASIPSWADVHGRDFQTRHMLFQKAIACCALLLAPSAFVRDVFLRNGISKPEIRILPLGIPPPEDVSNLERREGLRFGYIGWFQPPKGVHLLIEAFRRLSEPWISLHLFGPVNASHPYIQQLHQLSAGDPRIIFRGSFPPEERSRIYRSIDLLVIPSISPETFSRAAREALVYHVPVVASRIGALPEVIHDGVNGFLFDPGDLKGLHQVLQRIARHPLILKELSLPGPIQILSIEDHIRALEGIYREILSAGVRTCR